jgi:DNA-binding HxlR family transcriptional regulator
MPAPQAPVVDDRAHDCFRSQCPARLALDRVADKWVMLAFGALEDGPARFNMLKRRIEGVSQKMLTSTLRALERDGLVARRVIDTSPVSVEYSITPLGRTLAVSARALREWSHAHLDEVLAAQAAYDARHPPRPRALSAAGVKTGDKRGRRGPPQPSIASENHRRQPAQKDRHGDRGQTV